MASAKRIKRRVLSELVAQNVELMRGSMPWKVRRGRRYLRVALRWAVAALVPAGLALPSYWVLSSPPTVVPVAARADRSPATPEGGSEAGAGAEAAPAPIAESLTSAPRPVDSAVFPLAVRRVVIDPGHGGPSPGTRTPAGVNEKDITLDIGLRLRRLLEADSFEVVMTRDSDVDVALQDRSRIANGAKADLFVSIHVNWIANQAVRGVETYYLGATDDPILNQFAARENRGSGYSLTDMRDLLEGIFVGVRQQESRALAEAIQTSLLRSQRKINPSVVDRGVKTAPFIVLMNTDMPAVLAEVSCLSNEQEADLLAKPLYREFLAEAVFAGIRAYSDALENPELKRMS